MGLVLFVGFCVDGNLTASLRTGIHLNGNIAFTFHFFSLTFGLLKNYRWFLQKENRKRL